MKELHNFVSNTAGPASTARRPLRVALVGSSGRMGRRVIALAAADPRVEVTAEISRGHERGLADDAAIHAVIDFSRDAGARRALELAASRRAAVLVASTALSEETLAMAAQTAAIVPVMVAPNLSRGVAILRRLVAEAVRLAGPGWDLDLIEQHHRTKLDAPSGTARMLAEVVRDVAGTDRLEGRMHALRGGGVIGDHELRLSGPSEVLSLAHRAVDRDVFARGAIDAAVWLASRSPGLHRFEEFVAADQSASSPLTSA